MSAEHAWKRLNQAINVAHYIGPNAKAEIEKAINPPKPKPKVKAKAKVEGSDGP